MSWFLAVEVIGSVVALRAHAFDFYPSFWQPWQALQSGVSPYPDPAAPLAQGSPFLYPPLAAEITLPLASLSFAQAFAVYTGALVAAAALTLWALKVRQPALWVIWMLGAAVVGAAAGGNATLFVILAVALTWRWRDRPAWAAAALTAGLVLKLFVWPVWLWLVFTRRYRAAIYTAVASAVLTLASWAIIGFRGMLEYPALLNATSDELGANGLLAYALTVKVSGPSVAFAASLAVALVFLAAAFVQRDDDRAGIALVVLASLYATPIVWLHYLGLLIIPAALYGGWVWAAIPLLWLSVLAPAGSPRPGWLIACFIAITGAVAARALVDAHARHADARYPTRLRVVDRARGAHMAHMAHLHLLAQRPLHVHD
jgi:MFS family permease